MSAFWVQVLRAVAFLLALFFLYRAQHFWFGRAWRFIARFRRPVVRALLRSAWAIALLAVLTPFAAWLLRLPYPRYPRDVLGLWLASALFAWLGVKAVAGLEWLWNRLRARAHNAGAPLAQPLPRAESREAAPASAEATHHAPDLLHNPSRRLFFRTATFAAGALPFAVSLYGFNERFRFRIERVEIPIPNLPEALDGLRIAQLSDIHIGVYMPRDDVRRAVEMANELAADLTVVTGDCITGAADPLEACIEELAALRAPLGVWGCNGNHEIYADKETLAADLFRQGGMRMLRQENAQIAWRGQPFNLIGVDYQRTFTVEGRRLPMLHGAEPLVRSGMPNILLSHNPNAFPRAAQLGIDLTLAGHTHGGQVQVEILHQNLNPARFMTPFTAGLYHRPAGVSPNSDLRPLTSSLYVNRGLGTVAAPVRFNAPPEISLLTLRRA